MSLLEGFTVVEDFNQPFISLTKVGVTFSRMALEDLDYAEFVHLFMKADGKKMAVQVCEKDENAITLVKNREKTMASTRGPLVRWLNRDLIHTLEKLIGRSCENGVIRINGEFHPEEKVIVFDLNNVAA